MKVILLKMICMEMGKYFYQIKNIIKEILAIIFLMEKEFFVLKIAVIEEYGNKEN
jgi:hypothetical protein